MTMATPPSLIMVTRNLPPLRGGMERLNAEIAKALALNHRLVVIAPKGSRVENMPSVRILTCPVRGVASFLVWAAFTATFMALRRRPRWIVGGSGLVAPVVWAASMVSGARRATYLHGLDIVVRSMPYQAMWLPAIRRMHLCIVNSRNTRELAAQSGIDRDVVDIVAPGVAIPRVREDAERREADARFRRKFGLGSGPIILSVGRMTERKGLLPFVERAMPAILAGLPEAQLVIVGDDAMNALHKAGSGQRARVRDAALRAGLDRAVRLLGPIDEADLEDAFSSAHVHVFPGIDVEGDVEGFGMVAIEAAAHGVPTVAFAVGGVGDAIDDPSSGDLIQAGDYDTLVSCLLTRMRRSDSSSADACRAFANRFAWPVFADAMRATLDRGGR